MRLLVTGGAGYIGSHVVLDAIDRGYDVTVFDDLSTGLEENINENTQFIKGSTLSKSDLSKLFKSHTYDAVIHLAASKAAGESMLVPIKYAQNNIIGGLNLINACCEHQIKVFIFSSSAAVYGLPQYNPIDESHPLLPANYYGFTKSFIEENLKWFSNLEGMRYASLRYFNAAGYDLKKRVSGLEIDPQNLIPLVMETAIGIRSKIEIYGNDYNTKDGTGVRDYVHVSDLAKAHIDSIEYIHKEKKDIVINLGTGRGHSVLDIISKVSEISHKKIEYTFEDRRNGDTDIVIAKADLAKKLFGWNGQYSDLDTIIKSTWRVYKSRILK